MYYHKNRLKKYFWNEKYYEFDKKLRILFLDFLEVVELNFRKNFIDFLENNEIDIFKENLYRPKYKEKQELFFEEKIKSFENKRIKIFLQNWKINNFALIENLTFWELITLFQNFTTKNKKLISKKYPFNTFLIENWLFIAKYLRNICSHYENLFNLKWFFKLDSKEIYEKLDSNNSFLSYFLMLSILEYWTIWKNDWQNKVIKLINDYDISTQKLNLNNKKSLPSKLESEAWKEFSYWLYTFYLKKSNLFSKKNTNYKNFWQKQIEKQKKLCFLAPMDGYWDSAYRQVVKKIAPHTICVSEFYSADWLFYSKFLADSVLPHTKSEKPLIIQIFWKNPEMFAKAAKIIEKEKYDIFWIDINMWCPAKKVVKSGHWSGLLINEKTAFEIIETIDKIAKLPISVKTRLSFDWNQDLINFWKGLEKAGCKLLTVHWRTAKQAYSWTADWTQIYELKEKLNIFVIWNGDVKNFTDWMEKIVCQTWKGGDLDWFMIGRWSFWNPWCFIWEEHLEKYSWLSKNNFVNWIYYPTLFEILEIMIFHANTLVETKWEHKWSLEIRKHLVLYLKNFPWVKAYRKRLVTTDSFSNTKEIIEEIRVEFGDFLEKRPWLGEITKESLGIN